MDEPEIICAETIVARSTMMMGDAAQFREALRRELVRQLEAECMKRGRKLRDGSLKVEETPRPENDSTSIRVSGELEPLGGGLIDPRTPMSFERKFLDARIPPEPEVSHSDHTDYSDHADVGSVDPELTKRIAALAEKIDRDMMFGTSVIRPEAGAPFEAKPSDDAVDAMAIAIRDMTAGERVEAIRSKIEALEDEKSDDEKRIEFAQSAAPPRRKTPEPVRVETQRKLRLGRKA